MLEHILAVESWEVLVITWHGHWTSSVKVNWESGSSKLKNYVLSSPLRTLHDNVLRNKVISTLESTQRHLHSSIHPPSSHPHLGKKKITKTHEKRT
jgi:hypothetical protein